MAAQTGDDQLASFYLESGEYDKAKLYYEKLYDGKPTTQNYKGLLLSYRELGEYKEAEKLIKKHGKRSRTNTLYIDLGEVYEAQGEQAEADKAYRQAISALPKSQGVVIRTANEFIRLNKLDLALETYQEGKKLLDGKYPFSYEIASLYGTMGNKEQMISEYLDLLVYNEAYQQTIQNALNRSINFEEDEEGVELLRTELLRRVQKNPDSIIYAEMLIWMFLQDKEFNSAYVQLKALDKRLGEDGQRLLQLAGLCTNNGDYAVAEKCYQYIADKGRTNPYYTYARAGVLKSRFQRLIAVFPPDTAALQELRSDYSDALNELGASKETVGLMRQKAALEGYYLGDLEAANVTLNEAIETNAPSPAMLAEIKLELAEILIAKNYIWDASLLASQVDKDFKNDILGSKAKFLNARISYYSGDFSWAQAQLDILKGSTSKLISNDAMELSLLITDNLNLDTILEPMLMYSRADLLAVQRNYSAAEASLDSILTEYPGHSLQDEILMLKGRMAESRYDYKAAISFYEEVLQDHYFDISADNALYRMAQLYEQKLGQPNEAADLYKQLMVDFPGSLYVVESRKRYRDIRGDVPNSEAPRIIPEKIP